MLNPSLLGKALDTLKFRPKIDLFASRLNRQFPTYCSFRPDPEAFSVDAFTIGLIRHFTASHLLAVFYKSFRR